jgi:DNA polymerase III epsilon subunit-like protein
MHLIFLDTETTGNDVAKDRLCQLCYKTERDGVKVGYFKPPIPISVKAMSVTHITNKMVEDKEPFEGSQMKADLQALLDDGVLIAHNAKFDKAILEAEGMTISKWICTLRVARFLDAKGVIPEYNLQFLRYYLDVEVAGNAHDAEGDVNVLEQVFGRLISKVKETEGSEEKAIEKMIEISSKPSLYRVFNFGKHKDKTIEDVMKIDKGYLEWLLNQKVTSGDNDEDWIYTLKYYLKK